MSELREFVRAELEKQLNYYQQQSIRRQVTTLLTKDANWDMPAGLVNKQTNRELQRQVLELQKNGFDENQIVSYINASRRNATESTVAALREHFVLEKIAEDLAIEPTTEEYDAEIKEIADNSDSSERQVRVRLERTGQLDALRNQIIERRVIEQIVAEANVTESEDTSFLRKMPDEHALNFSVAPTVSDIPEAKYENKLTDGQTEGATVKLQS